jgi:hypothetical protein
MKTRCCLQSADGEAASALTLSAIKTWNGLYHCFDLIDRDELRAFKLARRVVLARTPQEVFGFEATRRIVPANCGRHGV